MIKKLTVEELKAKGYSVVMITGNFYVLHNPEGDEDCRGRMTTEDAAWEHGTIYYRDGIERVRPPKA